MGAKWHDTVVGFSRSCLVVGVTTVVVVVVGLFAFLMALIGASVLVRHQSQSFLFLFL